MNAADVIGKSSIAERTLFFVTTQRSISHDHYMLHVIVSGSSTGWDFLTVIESSEGYNSTRV